MRFEPRARAAVLLALVSLLGGSGPARAGAWLQEPGTAYLRLSAGTLSTRERLDQDGRTVPFDAAGGGFRNTRYEDLAVSMYAEVGLVPGWNLVAAGSWKRLQANQPSAVFETYGFSDLAVGVKRGLWRGSRGVASVLAAATIPTGYAVEEYPALGSGIRDLSLGLSAGSSFTGYWGNLDAAYVFRGGVFRDRVEGALGGGTGIGSRVGLRGEARGGVAVGSSPARPGEMRFDPATVDPDNLDLAATVSVAAGRGVAVEAEARTTVWGRNTLSGTRWSLALATSPAWRWKR